MKNNFLIRVLFILAILFSSCTDVKYESENKTLIYKGYYKEHLIPCSKKLGEKRTIVVFLPSDYYTSKKRYPVLYMQDAQSLFKQDNFFDKKWQVDIAIEKLMQTGKTEGVIIVGINKTNNRNKEYIPWEFMCSIMGGLGDEYVEFIVKELKPFIDDNYRTKPERDFTGIAGSSFGGLISFYGGIKHQEVFKIIGAFSPSFWTKDFEMIRYLEKQNKRYDMRIYMDAGKNEWDFAKQNLKVYNMLRKKGFGEKEIYNVVDTIGKHEVESWRRRFLGAFFWMYGE